MRDSFKWRGLGKTNLGEEILCALRYDCAKFLNRLSRVI